MGKYIKKSDKKSIRFAIDALECTLMSGDLTPEAIIDYEQHIAILKQLITDNK